MKKVLLYSGGMDSWLVSHLWKPDVKLYIDTGSSYTAEEKRRLPPDVTIEHFDLSRFERADKIIPLRNLFFVMLASYYGDEICLGATYGDRVLDKSVIFAQKASGLLSYLYQPQHWTAGRRISVITPFKDCTKAELLRKYLNEGGDIETAFRESFSCYEPDDKGNECWRCKPCARKAVAFLLNGYHFENPAVLEGARAYIAGILPEIHAGTYGRGPKEENEIIKAYQMMGVKNEGLYSSLL